MPRSRFIIPCLLSWLLVPLAALASGAPVAGAIDALPRDVVIPRVTTMALPDQQYSLYLPAGYGAGQQPGRRWPVLVILDARGRGEMSLRLGRDGARRRGWIVLSSYQSRSDTDENITLQALQALLHEVAQRYAYDDRRVYLAGFSGTAKTLWTRVAPLHRLIAGIIGCGGGRPPELGALQQAPAAFFGIAGSEDFNYQQMQDLDDELAKAGATHRLAIFDGPHGWPPDPAVFSQAIDWFDLVAMRQDRMPRDDGWIDRQFAAARAHATAAPDALERWRRLDQLARDFAGLRDVAAVQAEATALEAQPEVRARRKLEQRLRGEERRSAQRLDDWLARASQRYVEGRPADPPGVASAMMELRIRPLQKQAAGGGSDAADSARRRLELMYVATSFYLPEKLIAGNDLPRAVAMLKIASAIFPDRPRNHWLLARVQARAGDIDDAFAQLEASRALGYLDAGDLRDNPDWAPLRNDPRWQAASAPLPP
jgi:predicted esterase